MRILTKKNIDDDKKNLTYIIDFLCQIEILNEHLKIDVNSRFFQVLYSKISQIRGFSCQNFLISGFQVKWQP